MFFLIIGIAIGYFFKPQITSLIEKVLEIVKDNRKNKLEDE